MTMLMTCPNGHTETCDECALAEELAAQESRVWRDLSAWRCPEPGCEIAGAGHAGPHRKLICEGDVTTITWTEPGAYLAAIRPLAARTEGR